ncbi:hypothetical protein U9M48_009631 [Paspalum notatum var. saurae]|uniref:N-acetyltransferase domain-containing protein n=1 Tax=Paspalum notatum var. saurae TaxID=547442 RepID=A0AAQ3SRL1_PASNO
MAERGTLWDRSPQRRFCVSSPVDDIVVACISPYLRTRPLGFSHFRHGSAVMAAPPPPAILELDPSHNRAGRVIEDIVRLERRIFPKHESLARSLHDELKRRNSGLIYASSVADGEEVVGYAMYTCNTSLCATITKLAVKESCRRQGHGEALLRAAVERCRGRRVQRVILHVDPARTAAVALYGKAGFRIDTTVEGYYAPQRDAYRMFIDLEEQ